MASDKEHRDGFASSCRGSHPNTIGTMRLLDQHMGLMVTREMKHIAVDERSHLVVLLPPELALKDG